MNLEYELSQIKSQEAPKIISLYLSKSSSPVEPHLELGFPTQRSAFEFVAEKFHSNPNTIKNDRDAFDNLSDSSRRGWQNELRPALKSIWNRYGSYERSFLLLLCKKILELSWEDSEMPMLNNKMLLDLDEVKPKEAVISFPVQGDFALPPAAISLLAGSLPSETYKFETYTGHQYNQASQNYCLFPNQYLYYMVKIKDFAKELFKYVLLIEKYKTKILEVINKVGDQSTNIEKGFIAESWLFEELGARNIRLLSQFIGSDRSPNERRGKKVINQKDGSLFLRPAEDVFGSEILAVINVPNSSSGAFGELLFSICKVEGLLDSLDEILEQIKLSQEQFLSGGQNIIFYGAPGTGKSYRVENEFGIDQQYTVKTVFHPDTQNSDFIGALKPAKSGEVVTYEFSPGPFSVALAMAFKNPAKKVALIIEELNRAPAAAVFGDLFLLLDRNEDGSGQYKVDFVTREFKAWFENETGISELKFNLPSNMWILATMNSADQGVYPLDAAFRRRWHQEYIPIDYENAPAGDIDIFLMGGMKISVPWKGLLEQINKVLSTDFRVGEDRLIGHRFLSDADLKGKTTIPQKALLYLFDDVLRHENERSRIFDDSILTVGDLIRRSESGKRIFSESFLSALPESAPKDGI